MAITVRVSASTVTPSFVLFALVGFADTSDFAAYLKVVRTVGSFSAAEKAFRVAKASAKGCADALKVKGFDVKVAREVRELFFATILPRCVYMGCEDPRESSACTLCAFHTDKVEQEETVREARKAAMAEHNETSGWTADEWEADNARAEIDAPAAVVEAVPPVVAPAPVRIEPTPGTLAFTAMMMMRHGHMTGEQADRWVAAEKEKHLNS